MVLTILNAMEKKSSPSKESPFWIVFKTVRPPGTQMNKYGTTCVPHLSAVFEEV